MNTNALTFYSSQGEPILSIVSHNDKWMRTRELMDVFDSDLIRIAVHAVCGIRVDNTAEESLRVELDDE